MPIIAKLLFLGNNAGRKDTGVSNASPAGPHDNLVRQKPEDGRLD